MVDALRRLEDHSFLCVRKQFYELFDFVSLLLKLPFRICFFARWKRNMSVLDKVRSIFKSDSSKPGSPVRGAGGGPKIWTMPPEMQREFEKGVKYNMKVILRGMRGTGKSSLLARLHGHAFPEKYIPSPEISAATIRYQSADAPEDHGTKVELWDVVDVGLAPPGKSSSTHLAPLADASTIDVYRGCHCVIFLVDPMRKETLDYVLTESRNVPATAAILVALNFMDLPKPHVVTERDVDALCRRLTRATTPMILLASQGNPPESALSAAATWVSISARTSHGVSVLKSFLEIPVSFVHLTTLETQMKSIYQKIEVHQAWMLSERARLNFEEKERVKASSSADELNSTTSSPHNNHAAPHPSTSAGTSPTVGSTQPPPGVVDPRKSAGETILVQIAPKKPQVVEEKRHNAESTRKPAQPAKAPRKDETSNELSNDFFGDVSDDEDEAPAPPSSSSSSDDDVPVASPPRNASYQLQARRNSPLSAKPEEAVPTHQGQRATDGASSAVPKAEVPKPVIASFEAPPALPSALLRSTPAIRDEHLAVDEPSSKAVDDFFGSSEDDDEIPDEPPRSSSSEDGNGQDTATPPVHHDQPPMTVAIEEKSALETNFFGNDSDDEKSKSSGRHTPTIAAESRVLPVATVGDEATTAAHRPSATEQQIPQVRPLGNLSNGSAVRASRTERRTFAEPSKPVAAKPAASIDVSALLAQMQSAMVNAPPIEDDAADDGDGAQREKDRRRKEKKDKPDKRGEKRDKKAKKAKKATTQDSDDSDGGFVVEE